jgi:transposase
MRRNTACQWTPGGSTWRLEEFTPKPDSWRRWRPKLLSPSLRSTASEQIPVPVLGHPFGAREVALEGASRPFGFTGGIDVQDDPSHFCPVRTFGVGIEQTQIGDEMFMVIGGQTVRLGGLIGNRGIEWRLGHDHVRLCFNTQVSAEPRLSRTGVIIFGSMIRHDDRARRQPRRRFSTISDTHYRLWYSARIVPTTDQLHNMEPDMTLYAGLDVSLALTSICIVDAEGVVVRETKVSSEPEAICSALKDYADRLRRVGLEAGPLSQHLYSAMAEAGLPAICVDVRHMARLLRAQTGNKTDRNDARGIAQMMRVGIFKVVHVKTERSQRLKVLLTVRKVLKSKLLDIEADLRGVLKNFGLKLGKATVRDFEARVRELAAFDQFVAAAVDPALVARRALREQYDRLHSMLLEVVRQDDVCRRLMTMPGVGPVVALNYRVAIDIPNRFAKSRTVGAHLGLTPTRYQSGEVDWTGRISKFGDPMARASLYEAAQVLMTRVARWSPLRSWAMRIAKRRGRKRAVVALARKMGVILHRMWVDEKDFRWEAKPA